MGLKTGKEMVCLAGRECLYTIDTDILPYLCCKGVRAGCPEGEMCDEFQLLFGNQVAGALASGARKWQDTYSVNFLGQHGGRFREVLRYYQRSSIGGHYAPTG
jgi:hypothetical protein